MSRLNSIRAHELGPTDDHADPLDQLGVGAAALSAGELDDVRQMLATMIEMVNAGQMTDGHQLLTSAWWWLNGYQTGRGQAGAA